MFRKAPGQSQAAFFGAKTERDPRLNVLHLRAAYFMKTISLRSA